MLPVLAPLTRLTWKVRSVHLHRVSRTDMNVPLLGLEGSGLNLLLICR
jgi:hypothetical protein